MKRSKMRDFIEFELRDLLGEVLDADIPGNRYDLASDRADKILEMIEDEGILTDKWEDETPTMSSSERVVALHNINKSDSVKVWSHKEGLLGPFPTSAAGKVQMVEDLLNPKIYDEYDNVIGFGEPMISVEQARELLGFPPLGEDNV